MSESIVIVEAGHRGVVLYLGAVENRVLGEEGIFHYAFCRTSSSDGGKNTKIPAESTAASNDLQEIQDRYCSKLQN